VKRVFFEMAEMEYQATFGIDCAVSHGFGLKSPDYVKRDEKLSADNDANALLAAAKLAQHYSRDYLSNPANDDFTTVTLLELRGPNGLMNQKAVLKKHGFDSINRFEWDKDMLVTKCSMLEHLLLLCSENQNLNKSRFRLSAEAEY
jgi:hypothetical protein